MKAKTLSTAAGALLWIGSAPALAGVQPDLAQDVRLAAGSDSEVRVHINGNSVTLTGHVCDIVALRDIEYAALRNGATEVINKVVRTPQHL